jgi:dipeptidyl aminopeptidase/acylaminoacyl peptidase
MKTNNKKRLLEAEDLCRFNLVSDLAISPDETKIAYTIENISEDKKKYFARTFMLDIKSGESRQFTFGDIKDGSLSWSPDGKFIAFVSTRNKKTGIYIIPAKGGAEQKIIEEDGAFTRPLWTPDGQELIFSFRFNDSHTETDETKKNEAPVYRHITRLFYRLDGSGFLPKDRFHIWKLNLASGKMKPLTRGKYDETQPAISRDGKWIVFISNRSQDPDLHINHEELFMMPSDGGKIRRVPTPLGPKAAPSFSPNGKMIVYVGHTNLEDTMGVTNFHIWTVGIKGKPAARDLVPRFDRQCFDQTICDTVEGHGMAIPIWSADNKKIYFAASDTGSTHLFYVPARGGLPTRITKKPCHLKNYSISQNGKHIAANIADLSNPGDIYLLPPIFNGDNKRQQLSHLNAKLFAAINFPKTQEKWFQGLDGIDLQGWIVTPPNFNRNRKYPSILEIHGGPRVQYGFSFFHEILLLASKGYVVFYTNPRGGGGRGETWAGTIVADWGGIDYMDCMAAADYMEKLPFINRNKMGVTGGSYGGYMTNWIVGHTPRFKAAVTQRSVVNLESFVGSSDFGYLDKGEFNGHPWENPDGYKRMSPLTYAKNVKTPLLILHNENDLRCSIEQAEELFATLKLMKKKVEFVRFPEEPHGLSRHGRPDRRIARLQWILKWFERYLK